MARKKKTSPEAVNRPLAVVRAFCAIGIAVCFFLPWLSVSCSDDQVFARMRGLDLLEGRMELVGKFNDALGAPVSAPKGVPDEPALWVWAGATALLVLLGVMGAAYGSRMISGASSLAAAVLLALYLWFFGFGFQAEREFAEERKRRGLDSNQAPLVEIKMHREAALHISAALAALILVLGLVEGTQTKGTRK